MFDFHGKTALVTGATSGIGYGVATALHDAGANVIVTGRDAAKLDALCKARPRCVACRGDLRTNAAVVELMEFTNRYSQLDYIVNAAGVFKLAASADEWHDLFQLHVVTPALLIYGLEPSFRYAGAVVNVSSINATRPFAGCAAYNTVKAALSHLTRSAAADLAPYGLRVNAVEPGVVRTDLHRRAGMSEERYAEFLERGKTTHPLGRVGSVEDVVPAILFLLSPAASWITGACLPVDGGRSLTVVR